MGGTWHPFNQQKGFRPLGRVVRAQGAWIELEDGRKLFDGVSSWWVNVHGHSHPVLVEAIAKQAALFAQVILADLDHAPARELSERLAAHLPGSLDHVFLSDDGSTAVEVALKLAWQAQRAADPKRHVFVAFEGAYHGDTLFSMSVGARDAFTRPFDALLRDTVFLPYDDPEAFARWMAVHGSEVVAVIVEPLVQGAAGFRFQRVESLQRIAQETAAHGALLIADEVMTAFGRLGALFASDLAQIRPDLLCMSKGITGGTLPLGTTGVSKELYNSFLSDKTEDAFLHGHSYTGNPLACAAALASLALFFETDIPAVVRTWEPVWAESAATLATHPRIRDPRFRGGIFAFDITGGPGGYLDKSAAGIKEVAASHGLHVRPMGNVVYLMPPLATPVEEVRWAAQKLLQSIDEVLPRTAEAVEPLGAERGLLG